VPCQAEAAPVSAPALMPRRRGALDMGGDSMSDSGGVGRRSSLAVPGSRLGGSHAPGGSEVDALYGDVRLVHRGRRGPVPAGGRGGGPARACACVR
jgi:hypothetical protein